MIRFLADASLNHAIVSGCLRREPTIDFLSAHLAKLDGVSDPDVLAIATEQNRILVSHDFQTMPGHFGRDVWLFVTPDQIRASWDRLQRYLGRSRSMWAYLLGVPDTPWPPPEAFECVGRGE